MPFVKGQSGNPAGKPKGTKSFHTDFDEVVKEIAKLNHITDSEARKILIKKAYSEAKEGNFPFYKDIFDRYYGKATENIDVKSDGKPIFIPMEVINKYDLNDDNTDKITSGDSELPEQV